MPSTPASESPRRRSPRSVYAGALSGSAWEQRRPELRRLFEEISPRYDRLNRLLSLGLDRRWRRWAVEALGDGKDRILLDLASGTGDLAQILLKEGRGPVPRADLSPELLRIGRRKLERSAPERSRFSPGIACEMERLPLRDASLDGVAQGFALRHCRAFPAFFRELFRVLRPGGRVSILDMRYPGRGFGTGLYRFYFRLVLPRLAALFGGRRAAYEMMVESVRSLPEEEELLAALRACGFAEVRSEPGAFGSVRLLTARRPPAGHRSARPDVLGPDAEPR